MRLPPGSTVLFRPPSLWEANRRFFLGGLGLVALQSALIAGLLAQRLRRRRAESRVRALNHRLLTAHEEERKALARELHDDLSQRLARLSIDVSCLEHLPATSEDVEAFSGIRAELTRLGRDVHGLAYQLHPSTLQDLGLKEAIRIECNRFAKAEAIPVRVYAGEAVPEPSGDGALCLFRITQEALRNVGRHARAREVDLSLGAEDGGVRLTVRDDGIGFDPTKDREGPSLGLAGMRERVELASGKIDVRSAPGQGTEITVWVPVEAAPS